jgi:hypothetical protein
VVACVTEVLAILDDRQVLVDALTAGEVVRRLGARVPPDALAALVRLTELAAGDAAWLARTVDALDTTPREAARARAGAEPAQTELGGAFLLVRPLTEVGEVDPALRHLALLAALGPPVPEALFHDPGLCLASGLPDDLRDAAAVVAAVRAPRLDAGRAPGHRLVIDAVEETTLVVRDVEKDHWLALGDRAVVRGELDAIARRLGAPPRVRIRPTNVSQSFADLPALDGDPALSRFERGHKPAADELAAVTLDLAPLAARPEVTRWVAHVAHELLRLFARRLMGFEWSSAGHLRVNFLRGGARYRVGPDGVEAYVAPRSLRMVLAMSGVDGETIYASWLPGDRLTTHLEAGG